MSEREEWGPWIDHDGACIPDEVRGRYVGVAQRSLKGLIFEDEGPMPLDIPKDAQLCWLGGGWFTRTDYAMPIVRYRIRRPRALANLIRLAADVEAPVEREDVPA